jgi:exopolyphosphatase / guanosine-5'-triphosphate,3'-diphosphate pyrophosphatase
MNIAVIDLGTNGFRLHIAKNTEGGNFEVIHRVAKELQLASAGIHHIGDAPFQRGLEAMREFSIILKEYNVLKVKAFATAALRIADNGQHFIQTVYEQTGITIELISGDREAELIYKGIRLGVPLNNEPVLMVDIGGGSVEFIIANKKKMLWAKSFNIGVAILKQRFHHNDPITESEIDAIKTFLDHETNLFVQQLITFKPKIPIIASGTLDYIVKILRGGYDKTYLEISDSTFSDFYHQLTYLTTAELKAIPEVPPDKIEMNTVCMVLMAWIMEKTQATKLIASRNSMKTGVLYELSIE